MKNKKNFIVGITLLFTLLLSACTSPADDSTPVVKKEDSSKPLQTIEGLPQSLELDFQESTTINFTSTGDGAFRITNISDIVDATYSGSNSAGYKLTINAKNAGRTNLTINRLTTNRFRSTSKTIALTVNQLNQTISTAQIPDPFTIMADETKDFPVSNVGDGHLIAESGNPAIALATTSGDNLIIRALSAGKTKITLRKTETRNYKLATTTLDLTVVGQGTQVITGLPKTFSLPFQDSTSINFTSIGAGDFSVTSSVTDVATASISGNNNNGFMLDIDIKKAGTTNLSIKRAATDTLSEATFDIALTITKADQTITGLTELIHLPFGATMDFTIGGNGDGALTADSEHSTIVTTSLTGNTLTLMAESSGDASITLSKAATDKYSSITKRYAVVVLAQGVKLNQEIDGLPENLSTQFQDSTSINFTSTGTGAFSVTSSTTDVATATVSGNNKDGFILDIDLKKAGTTTLSIKRAETSTHLEATFDIALTITKANQTITYSGSNLINLPFQDSNHTINFTSIGIGDFSVTSSTTDVATADIMNNGNNNFTLNIGIKKAGNYYSLY